MAITRTAGTSHTYGWFVDGASQGTGSRMELLPQPSRHASLHSLRGPALNLIVIGKPLAPLVRTKKAPPFFYIPARRASE